ncbi:hypothetical protein DY000_02045768 [Brassica cretica]|uniref:Uncharacterized protein n=1 Tax=Brassica cretica TaxID=69181 RepID=A0ABQ7F594_BRACR|nr:hypothetical protein DY000_02045768 [Brassica cretica]
MNGSFVPTSSSVTRHGLSNLKLSNGFLIHGTEMQRFIAEQQSYALLGTRQPPSLVATTLAPTTQRFDLRSRIRDLAWLSQHVTSTRFQGATKTPRHLESPRGQLMIDTPRSSSPPSEYELCPNMC